MKIAVIGTGYVGLVSGACLAAIGHDVTCVDNQAAKIESLENGVIPIYEPGLDAVVDEAVSKGLLSFTTSLNEAMDGAQAVLIAVGTPTLMDDHGNEISGAADLKYVDVVAEEIAASLSSYCVIVNKSTVPVGTAQRVNDIILRCNPSADIDVVSNPEFLREGTAVGDFMNPDRIVTGVESDKAARIMREIYQPLIDAGATYFETSPQTSELIKYASNAFLATKIAFINEMADVCEAVDANVSDLAIGMGLDSRIGDQFLRAGPGYGGSCFPKDTKALQHISEEIDAPSQIVRSVIESNDTRYESMVARVIEACEGRVDGKRIGLLGLTFKANTDDVRASVALTLVPALQAAGAEVVAYDPEGAEQTRQFGVSPEFAASAHDVFDNAAAVVVVTEWAEFKELDYVSLSQNMTSPTIVDFRNLLNEEDLVRAGIRYIPIGRKPLGVCTQEKPQEKPMPSLKSASA